MKFFRQIKENCSKLSNANKLAVVLLLVSTLALCGQNRLVGAEFSASGSASAGGDSAGSESSAASGSIQTQGGLSGSLAASSSSGSSSGSLSMGASGDSSTSAAASASTSGSSSGSSSGSASASGSMSVSVTPKPEGLLEKVKDMFQGGKEKVKSAVENLTEKKSASAEGSLSVGQSGVEASASVSAGKSEGGIMDKLSDMAKRGKEKVKDTAKGIKEEIKELTGSGSSSSGGGASVSGSINTEGGGIQANANVQIKDPTAQVSRLVSKSANEIGEKVSQTTEKFGKTIDESIKKPMSSVSGSGRQLSPAAAQAMQQNREASERQSEDRSVAVEVLDKVKEVAKMPAEKVLKPLDRAMGYEKDPLMKMYDNSIDLMKKPVKLVSHPVEAVVAGAFKTSDEARADSITAAGSEQERREALQEQERLRRGDRTVVGNIADKAVELAQKPMEIILKPFDHALGLDKNGKKNPLLQLLDDLYGLSKRPVDAIARPLESILKKMAQGDQAYQVSVRLGTQAANNDPKLITRLADGALNIADRVITRPLEIVFKPLDYALGYDLPGKKNPILNAAHSLKNATRIGIELFTRPIDRMLKEIADIGEIKDEAEREMMFERKRQEASRMVHALDKLHELAQTPWELVLRPVGEVLGYHKKGLKEPLLRAWDVVHQVVRTPLQVVSKPIEDALLGESKREQRLSVKASAKIGAGAPSKNFIVEKIKKVEKFAARPLDIITSPIRRLILGEHEAGNRAQARVQVGAGQAQAQAQAQGSASSRPDRIVTAIEDINSVALKPLEVITQPIADLFSGGSKKLDIKAQASASKQSGSASGSISGSVSSSGSSSGSGSGSGLSLSSSLGSGSGSASASASIKKN